VVEPGSQATTDRSRLEVTFRHSNLGRTISLRLLGAGLGELVDLTDSSLVAFDRFGLLPRARLAFVRLMAPARRPSVRLPVALTSWLV
jgi:hypothetical protein